MNRVREMRKLHNLSAKEVANEIGLSRPALSLIERGYRNPSIQVAFDLANFFGTSVEELFPQYKDNTKRKTPAGV